MIGWIGSLAFGLCAAPQALRSYKDGHAHGLSWGLLILWSIGEVFTFAAVLTGAPVSYLIFNYSLNAVFLSALWRYKLLPRRTS